MSIPAVEIPARMQALPLDARGYPVPVIIQRGSDGVPIFAVNDREVSQRCVHKKLCPICGQKLTKDLWFVGGPQSAFHPHGCYFDSAMHEECMRYALQVCPYLAMPKWMSRDAQQRLEALQSKAPHTRMVDLTQDSNRPTVFVALKTYGQQLQAGEYGTLYIRPLRPYHAVEFWQHGKRLPFYPTFLELVSDRNLDVVGCTRLVLQGYLEAEGVLKGTRGTSF